MPARAVWPNWPMTLPKQDLICVSPYNHSVSLNVTIYYAIPLPVPQRVFSWMIFIIGTTFIVVSLAVFRWRRHTDARLFQRSFGGLVSFGVGAWLSLFYSCYRDGVGRENFSCIGYIAAVILSMCLCLTPMITQFFLALNKHAFQSHLLADRKGSGFVFNPMYRLSSFASSRKSGDMHRRRSSSLSEHFASPVISPRKRSSSDLVGLNSGMLTRQHSNTLTPILESDNTGSSAENNTSNNNNSFYCTSNNELDRPAPSSSGLNSSTPVFVAVPTPAVSSPSSSAKPSAEQVLHYTDLDSLPIARVSGLSESLSPASPRISGRASYPRPGSRHLVLQTLRTLLFGTASAGGVSRRTLTSDSEELSASSPMCRCCCARDGSSGRRRGKPDLPGSQVLSDGQLTASPDFRTRSLMRAGSHVAQRRSRRLMSPGPRSRDRADTNASLYSESVFEPSAKTHALRGSFGWGPSVTICLFLNIPSLLTFIGLLLTETRYQYNCVGCEWDTADLVGFLISAIFFLIFFVVLSRRLRAYPDPLGLRAGTLLAMVPGGLAVSLALLLGAVYADPHQFGFVNYGWLLAGGFLWGFAVLCPYQLVVASRERHRNERLQNLRLREFSNNQHGAAQSPTAAAVASAQSGEPLRFADVLRDPRLRAAFKRHLASEFAQESLLCWEAVDSFERKYPGDSPEHQRWRANRIYQNFIAPDTADLLVNIPHAVTASLEKRFGAPPASTEAVPATVFAELKSELESLMRRGSFQRFSYAYYKRAAATSTGSSDCPAPRPPPEELEDRPPSFAQEADPPGRDESPARREDDHLALV